MRQIKQSKPNQSALGKGKKRSKATRMIKRIQKALSLDLLHKDYAPSPEDYVHACKGHCYIATEAAYYLFAREKGYVPYVYRYSKGTHWWLVNEANGDIIDPSEPQLGEEQFPYYHLGRRKPMRTNKAKQPSKRCMELMRRVEASGNK
jgi:hypothetical protein